MIDFCLSDKIKEAFKDYRNPNIISDDYNLEDGIEKVLKEFIEKCEENSSFSDDLDEDVISIIKLRKLAGEKLTQ